MIKFKCEMSVTQGRWNFTSIGIKYPQVKIFFLYFCSDF